MADDPLDVLLRLRRLTIDQARQALAECLRAETAAARRCEAIAEDVARQMQAATALTADDRAVEDFANWLRHTLPAQAAADAALLNAETQTREARFVLSAARAGVRAVESMLERKAAEQHVRAGRAEQSELDEAAAHQARSTERA